ncbi:MAG: thymidine phosphorylase [Acidobacteria bacterium]|nr:thymidine phosphorylase [Acidobacteriota bacterium]
MRPQEIIAVKRDGGELSRSEIDAFIAGVCDGSWADYQISAMVMAMFTRGLSDEEQNALTYAMLHSGEVLDLSDIPRPKADKHSTGGVGDKTSLIIAPILAACGIAVPMISGRGLGHTGGTLDKLEAIAGYDVNISTGRFREIISKCGFAMSGQTADIAPADKKLYALRDATATVPYIPLIVASIMSKKLAEGLDALVLDVKTGSGAFMPNIEDSMRLAEAMVQTGRNFGVRTEAVVSEMGRPLGRYAGNICEVYECVKILRNEPLEFAEPTRELSLELSARAIVLAGVEGNLENARTLAEAKLGSGEAYERFIENCMLQGGDSGSIPEIDPFSGKGLTAFEIKAERSGWLEAADALAIGESVVAIGGGRIHAEDSIDFNVGFECFAEVGREVREGDVLGVLYSRTEEDADCVSEKLRAAYKIAETPVTPSPLVHGIV